MRALAWFMAFCSGFLSLSQEILWVRIIGFMQQGVPQAFSYVLTCFLLGISLGAVLGKRVCGNKFNLVIAAGFVFLASGVLDLLITVLVVSILDIDPLLRWVLISLLIILTAALKSILFPIAHHLGSAAGVLRLGHSLSRVYFFNILGSTPFHYTQVFLFIDQ